MSNSVFPDYSFLNSLNSSRSLTGADKQMLFQERMSNSAHTREVQDLINAGLNPVLSAGGSGASTPTGASQEEGYSVLNPLYSALNTINSITRTNARSFGQAMKNMKDIIIHENHPKPENSAKIYPSAISPFDYGGFVVTPDTALHSYSDPNTAKPQNKSFWGKVEDYIQSVLERSILDMNKNPTKSGLIGDFYKTGVGKQFAGPMSWFSRVVGYDTGKIFNNLANDLADKIRGWLK